MSTFAGNAIGTARSGVSLGFFSLGHIDLAAQRFNSCDDASRGMGDVEVHLLANEIDQALDQTDAVERTADDTGLDQRGGVDDALIVELAAVDENQKTDKTH